MSMTAQAGFSSSCVAMLEDCRVDSLALESTGARIMVNPAARRSRKLVLIHQSTSTRLA